MSLTGLETLVDLVCGGLVATESDDGELGFDHTCM